MGCNFSNRESHVSKSTCDGGGVGDGSRHSWLRLCRPHSEPVSSVPPSVCLSRRRRFPDRGLDRAMLEAGFRLASPRHPVGQGDDFPQRCQAPPLSQAAGAGAGWLPSQLGLLRFRSRECDRGLTSSKWVTFLLNPLPEKDLPGDMKTQ